MVAVLMIIMTVIRPRVLCTVGCAQAAAKPSSTRTRKAPQQRKLVELRVFVRKGGKLKYELDGLRWKAPMLMMAAVRDHQQASSPCKHPARVDDSSWLLLTMTLNTSSSNQGLLIW